MSNLAQWFALAADNLVGFKIVIERSVAFSDDALHVFAGVLIQLAAAWVLRSSVASTWPWLIVFLCELINEALDLIAGGWPPVASQLDEGGKDILLTLALPTLLLLVCRFCPRLMGGDREARLQDDQAKEL